MAPRRASERLRQAFDRHCSLPAPPTTTLIGRSNSKLQLPPLLLPSSAALN
jgi:hypothetical protein